MTKAALARYWTGKSVLITGASSGIGWAITEALSRFGVSFCLLSRREERLAELADSLRDSSSTFWIRACDVRSREQVVTAVADYCDAGNQLDVAWVNSGISRESSFGNWDWQSVEDMIDTNLKGAIYTTHACLEVMSARRRGAIVGIGSAASMRGLPSRGIYSATKVGLEYYLQSLTPELPFIDFTLIHPGFVDTPINQNNPNRFWLLSPERAAQVMIKAVAAASVFSSTHIE